MLFNFGTVPVIRLHEVKVGDLSRASNKYFQIQMIINAIEIKLFKVQTVARYVEIKLN